MDINNFLASTSRELEGQIASYGLRTVGVCTVLLIILVVISALFKDKYPRTKLPLFLMIATVITGSTIFLFGSTVYLNVVSDSGGPVHWHADVEYWACGTEIELRDPDGFLSNKIGSPVLHEHNDKRIHLEGVVVDTEIDASIGHFMETVGGALSKAQLTIPLNPEGLTDDDVDGDVVSTDNLDQLESYVVRGEDDKRLLRLTNGANCGDTPSEVQVFVYNYNDDEDTYTQTKLEDPAAYVYSPEPQVPPGDCIIFEFDRPKNFTDKLCQQYGVFDSARCTQFGVEVYDPSVCNVRDVTDYSQGSERGSYQIAPQPEATTEEGVL